jgi:uncharacterized protein (TIGR03437 family)
MILQARTADDLALAIGSAVVRHDTGGVTRLEVSSDGIAFADMLPAGPASVTVDGTTWRIVLQPGGSRAYVVKPGPLIEAVEPAGGRAWPLVLAPGMLVAIRGVNLNAGAPELDLSGRPVVVISRDSNQLLAVLPQDSAGVAELTLRNGAGRHSVRVYLESAFPSLFLYEGLAAALHSSTGEPVTNRNPAMRGEIVSLFLTGLGTRDSYAGFVQRPVVTLAGENCEVLYAGPAPALAGVDQINVRLPIQLPAGAVRLEIIIGNRTASADLAVL